MHTPGYTIMTHNETMLLFVMHDIYRIEGIVDSL